MPDAYQVVWDIGDAIIRQAKETIVCEVCDSDMIPGRFISFIPFKEQPILVYFCQSCGFFSRNLSMFNKEQMRVAYKDFVIENRGFLNELRDIENRNNLREMMKFLPESPTIIDMGSGVGGLEYYARKENIKVNITSFDICQEIIDYASTQNIKVYPVDITDKGEIEGALKDKVDCIYSSNLLEHILHPCDVLKMWRGFLKEDGYMYVIVPTMDAIYCERTAFQAPHFSYFNQENFTKLAEKAGCKVISSKIIKKNNNAGTGSMRFILSGTTL